MLILLRENKRNKDLKRWGDKGDSRSFKIKKSNFFFLYRSKKTYTNLP